MAGDRALLGRLPEEACDRRQGAEALPHMCHVFLLSQNSPMLQGRQTRPCEQEGQKRHCQVPASGDGLWLPMRSSWKIGSRKGVWEEPSQELWHCVVHRSSLIPLCYPQRSVTTFLNLSDTHTQFLYQHSLLQTTPPSLPRALEESVMAREDEQQPGLSSGMDSRAALRRDKLAQEDSQALRDSILRRPKCYILGWPLGTIIPLVTGS